jgi:hypothetical protein
MPQSEEDPGHSDAVGRARHDDDQPADIPDYIHRHPVIVTAAVILLGIVLIVGGQLAPLALLDIEVGLNLTGLLAMLGVAAWRFGHRRS